MSSIYDNIEQHFLPELQHYLQQAYRADFCVGYFNLRGWQTIDTYIEQFKGGEGQACRLLVGMHRLPSDELKQALAIGVEPKRIDQGQAIRLKALMAEEFRKQLTYGTPSDADEKGLRRLRAQLLKHKLQVKLFLRYPLHAKLYLIYRNERATPIIGYVGSSNLTLSGLKHQGELNVEVLDRDDTSKLQKWFEDRWNDHFCLDISQELAKIIEESWAGSPLQPYYIYLKMAYHLSQDAREGLSRYRVLGNFKLLPFQETAVRIAAHYVSQRNGVIIGDVVGLGKTLVGTALAYIFEEEYGSSTLIICPKNLQTMWQNYVETFGLRGKVVAISRVIQELPQIPARFRTVLIDESHNLRNREGKRYQVIQKYIEESGSRCILLTATPYNKSYLDLSAQLRLFLRPDADLGIKPEAYIRSLGGEQKFRSQYSNIPVRSLLAFEKSEEPEDWQQLMSRYMVRRTRSFIKATYAKQDGKRYYLELADGQRFYLPTRQPRTLKFPIGDFQTDPYARLYSKSVVKALSFLHLPRYGLGQYVAEESSPSTTAKEKKLLDNLSHAGKRLMGFCRTNLFKRLESSGFAFLQSLKNHILRNYIYLYAIENNLPLPIGTQDASFLEFDTDEDEAILSTDEETEESEVLPDDIVNEKESLNDLQQKAAAIYKNYEQKYKRRFKWIHPKFFKKELREHLQEDIQILLTKILNLVDTWDSATDNKFASLIDLLQNKHPHDKILIFTQFADTANYLYESLINSKVIDISQVGLVTGKSSDPTKIVWRFSPQSNDKNIPANEQLRILISTDVLSEGQNLQDCAIIVNYDLPWAIIRLVQRAGRVDRIGQKAEEILCYSFLPADGVERIINLRGRLLKRMRENREVVGTDEAFFEDEQGQKDILNLYNEHSGILEQVDEGEVDLSSEALQVWENAIKANPELKGIIEKLPNVVYATREHQPTEVNPEGVLVYVRTNSGIDALVWMDKNGNSVTQSQTRIFRMAKCSLNTPAIARHPKHYELVSEGAKLIAEQTKTVANTLGKGTVAARVYERLMSYVQYIREKTPLLATGIEWENLNKIIEEINQYPLKQNAIARLNRELKAGISDERLAKLVTFLWEHNALCVINPEEQQHGVQIICSMGLFSS